MRCSGHSTRPTAPPARNRPPSKSSAAETRAGRSEIVLGWLIDTVRRTIELPPYRYARLLAILDSITPNQATTSRQWQQLLGELRSMLQAIPGGRGSSPPHRRLRRPPHTGPQAICQAIVISLAWSDRVYSCLILQELNSGPPKL